MEGEMQALQGDDDMVVIKCEDDSRIPVGCMDEELKSQLEPLLRNVYDDDEFVYCVFVNLGNDRNVEKMLSFFEVAKEQGDEVSHDDIVTLSIILDNELQID